MLKYEVSLRVFSWGDHLEVSIVDAPPWPVHCARAPAQTLPVCSTPQSSTRSLGLAANHRRALFSHFTVLCPALQLLLPHPPWFALPIFVDCPCCYVQLSTMAFPAFLTALAPLPLAPSPRAAVCTRRAVASRRPAGLRMLGGAAPPTPPPADGDDKSDAPAAAEASTDAAAAPEAASTPDVQAEDAPAADVETTADDILSSPVFLKKKMEVRSISYARPP